MLAIHLKPLGPFHLQTGGLDHEQVDTFPRSDTLSAALMYLWARQFGSIPGLPDDPPFLVSSIFPSVELEQGEIVKLFPRPKSVHYGLVQNESGSFGHKEFKRIQWLDENLFRLSLNGMKALLPHIPASPDDPRLWFNGSVWCKSPRPDSGAETPLVYEQESTRVVLDRVTNASMPFHYVTTRFAESVNLYLLARVKEEHRSRFLGLLHLLGDEGIGGDRTIGMGRFEVLGAEEWNAPKTENPSHWVNLGVFNPAPNSQSEVKWEHSSYGLLTRNGWVTEKALRRRSLRVLDEGSVLASSTMPEGRIVNVLDKEAPDLLDRHREYLSDIIQLDHPVYRDGRTIWLPMKLDGE